MENFVLKEPTAQKDHQNQFCVVQVLTTHFSVREPYKTALYVLSRLLILNTELKVVTLVVNLQLALRVLNSVVVLEKIVFIQILTAHVAARQVSTSNLQMVLVRVHLVI
jgi:hypothetical protein